MTKQCCDCKRQFETTEFYKNAARSDGLSQRCRECSRAHVRHSYYKRQAADPQAHAQKRYYENIKYLYGMTPEQYELMLQQQGGHCAVCPAITADTKKTRLHVDHNHETGVIRGLLCTHCNQSVGCADDSPVRLRALAAYLERT
jgi:hypothetical protein